MGKPRDKSLSPIWVWRFEDAPEMYRSLSDHGGDEDWVAYVPKGYNYIPWLREGGEFGCCRVSEYEVIDGTIYIGAHA